MNWSRLATILLGVVLIVIITPLSQFLTIKTLNVDIETASPVGWAVGVILSLVLALAVVRLISASRLVCAGNVVVLYCMLTIAAPVMNVGLVRHVFLEWWVAPQEYVLNGTNTYYTLYTARDARWNPSPPTPVATAWHEGHRLLRELDDAVARGDRARAVDAMQAAVRRQASRLRREAEAAEAEAEAARQEAAAANDAAEDGPPTDDEDGDEPDPEPEPEPDPELARAMAEREQAIQQAIEQDRRTVAMHLPHLGVDEAISLRDVVGRDRFTREAAELLNLDIEAIDQRQAEAEGRSADARRRLEGLLRYFQEVHISQAQPQRQAWEYSDRMRIERDRERRESRDPDQLAHQLRMIELLDSPLGELMAGTAAVEVPEYEPVREALGAHYADAAEQSPRASVFEVLRMDAGLLSEADQRRLRAVLQEDNLERYAQLTFDDYWFIRASLIFRKSREDRPDVFAARSDRLADQPAEDLRSFRASVWADSETRRIARQQGVGERVREVMGEIPWHVWAGPMLRWGVLLTVLFLLLMCLAEWLRRKWIERENLAFPLVEVADHIIRHDQHLEEAEDPRRPQPRSGMFNPYFLVGSLVGFGWVFLEAMWHYGVMRQQMTTTLNISDNFFTTGIFQELGRVALVISPIVLGIAFLVSLEISFSVWAIFWLYSLLVLLITTSVPGEALVEHGYVGWAGGRFFPFEMEQLLGACVALTLLTLYKAWRSRQAAGADAGLGTYLPRSLTMIGLIGLPLVALALLYDYGITNVLFMALMGAFMLAQVIAMARARAETGLHTHHVSYEFTRLPIIFGATGWTGAKVYALFSQIVFLPITLLGRLLPQQLENLELARRNNVHYRTIAVATLAAFLTAIGVGMITYLVMSYYIGSDFWGAATYGTLSDREPYGLAAYSTWVSHFLGEPGLDKWTRPHPLRIGAMVAGFGIFLSLAWLRGRFLSFPLHPMGYFLILACISYNWITPYHKHDPDLPGDASLLWGSVLVAWVCKKLIIKYGGMTMYKKAKPIFIGLIVGSVFCVFALNMLDLGLSLAVFEAETDAAEWIQRIVEVEPFSPRVY